MAYEPLVYRTSGGDEQVVSTGGRLLISGTLQLTTGATLTLAGQTITSTGAVAGSSGTFTGSVAITSGITGSSAAITNGITGSSLAITNGITGSSLAITNGITGSSLAITNGITGSSLAITNGITGSSVSLTNGIAASTGTFTGAVSVGGNLTASLGFIRYLESATSSASTITAYGISIVKSTEDAEHVMSMGAPVAGIEKYIVCNEVLKSSGVSTGAAIITSSGASVAIGSYTSILFTTGAVNNQWIHLIGQNSTNWVLIGQSTDVTLSAT